jgi:hypothetical protein
LEWQSNTTTLREWCHADIICNAAGEQAKLPTGVANDKILNTVELQADALKSIARPFWLLE